jgi:DNA-binding beta-propeller fold protein YncE
MKKYFFLIGISFCLSAKLNAVKAQANKLYVAEKKIALPGNGGYDYVSIDSVNNHLFVSHGTTVDVVDLKTEESVGVIKDMKGVHGIAIVNDLNRGFISDGRGKSVVAFDLTTFKTIAVIPLSKEGADGILYDPFSKRVLVFCGDANSACVIDVNNLKEVSTIDLGGAPEFAVSDGKGLVYNNLEDKNQIAVIDTKNMKVITNWPLSPCGGPTGMALDQNDQRLFTVCRENKGMSVVDITSGKVVATIPIGAGVDAVAYDAKTKLIIVSNADGTATIIKQTSPDDYSVVQTLQTTNRAKTMALDYATHKIYFSAAQFQPGTRNIIPDSFAVLVYSLQ